MNSLDFEPIGYIKSCYQEKFGIPCQPGLVPSSKAQLILTNTFNKESVRGLDGFSHIWLQFMFHETQTQGWKSLVRPPRLGGNKKVGVFATRSTFRPNSIGLSVVKLDKVEIKDAKVMLHLLGCDLLNKTPVLDIKPYLPYVDAIHNARGGFAQEKPDAFMEVIFSEQAIIQSKDASERLNEDISSLIREILALDPKPSYQKNTEISGRIYRMKLYDFDLSWQYCENNKIRVLAISSL